MLTNPGDINHLTHDIIGCAMRVHQVFGSGLLERTYAVCVEIELNLRGHAVRRKRASGNQLLTYLRLAEKPVGLLITFNEQVLKDGIKRVINPDSLDEKNQP